MNRLDRFIKTVDIISEWCGKIFAWFIVVATLLMLYEVTTRRFFGEPTIWATEVTTMVFGAYFVMLMAYTLLHDRHVRMDVFSSKWSDQDRAYADIIGYLFFFSVFVGICLVGGFFYAKDSFLSKEGSGSILNAPLWPVKTAIPLGFAMLLFQGIVEFIKKIRFLRRFKK